jgi:hypothetical protein
MQIKEHLKRVKTVKKELVISHAAEIRKHTMLVKARCEATGWDKLHPLLRFKGHCTEEDSSIDDE